MYLKHIGIKNVGPIDELSVNLTFDNNSNPKPIIFIGENGAGKTILLSQIIDSLYEITSQLFDDIGINNGIKKSYYKISGGINVKIGQHASFSALSFTSQTCGKIEYFDKSGIVNLSDIQNLIPTFTLQTDGINGNQKKCTAISDTTISSNLQSELVKDIHFFQPANRYEEPYWKNDAFKETSKFEDKKNYSDLLGKEIEIVSSNTKNKSYILDIVLDVAVQQNKNIDLPIWENINKIIQAVKQNKNVTFGIGPRSANRVSLVEVNESGQTTKQLVPSIDNLSLGESILFNLFLNIIRHGDNPPRQLSDMEGIVVIDEIDVHLHTNLQNTVLPKLIRLFPKIQFIMSTHSPLFILGMKQEFGEDGFELIDMPSGKKIATERFSEFRRAYEVYKNTTIFENEIQEEIAKANKPILFVEDEYNQIYKIAYLKLNDIECDEHNFESKFNDNAFFTVKTGKSAGGVAGLLRSKDASLFEDKKIVGLFDFDKEGRENFHLLHKENFWDTDALGDIETGYYKKRKDHLCIYALLIPVPKRLQSFASLEWENFASYVEIENLLPTSFTENSFFEEKTCPGDLKYQKCKKDIKGKLWKELFKLEKNDFFDFGTLYKTLESLVLNNTE